MKYLYVALFSLWLTPALAMSEMTAKQWLDNMATAVKQRNFVASFVVVKDRAMEPYRWSHGIYQEQELELLTLLNGAGLEMVRVDDQVTYYEPQNQPYSIATNTIAGPIPEVLFSDIDKLQSNYRFVLGNKGRIAGRPAQQIRIEAKDQDKYNYWLWLDTETSLLLKSAYVNHSGELLEQLQLSHISVTEQPAPELVEISQREFPTPLPKLDGQSGESSWSIGWLPQGFELLKADRHKLNMNNELADYYLYSDGLVDVSVFVQRPLASQRPSGALTSGATTVYIHNAGAYDVSVIGNIPTATAKNIAESVQRPL
ncbi:Sigma-E factor regulatory protein RseB precursor [Pseudoalteromonas sp. THAF3]|uniref:Anti-sigma E factor n=2 Tax=Pseudoalteromonas TaxID=53246 RepID=A0A5S3Z8E9_9GAMM|nr:Sigma-E factor regulatory protein RseB precursor [Pseudoalteromonas sp. THAF3]TLX52669.1 anti-sigma E factor [Pseudoalteromonas ruthenica]TMO43751.1 anti-sigma E factor [Pseudoalteromonas ruthenica]TMO51780.1 anti-sigma E factor [Pseudoalteromonas ruthenica]TMP87857.1 anti-sigma E factor [Pseudoalteromonas ruthenica]|tara:strand:+ start:9468 stop:10409 length:942 start_codon:yes stop_codon:yes gene_type:complete